MRVRSGRSRCCALVLAILASVLPLEAAAEKDTVVAVFPVSTVSFSPNKGLRESMWAYIEAQVAETPGYRVVPHEALEAAIRERHKRFLSQRYDPETQAEVGRQVAASQSVSTRIIRFAGVCKVNVTVYDIARQVSTISAGAEGPCSESGLLVSLRAALKQIGPRDRRAPPPSPPPLTAANEVEVAVPTAVRRPSSPRPAQARLTVGIQPWGGYVGGPYFNGGLEPSGRSRFLSEYNLEVQFRLLESIPASVRAWRAREIDVLWITVDDLPTEYAQLAPLRPRLFMLAGWSRGEEVLIVGPEIRTLNELKGKRIALVPKTSAHSFLLISLDLAGLEYRDLSVVPARDDGHAADLFIRREVDAAMVWIDERERCLHGVEGAYELESTKDASYLIAESLVVRGDVLASKAEAVRNLAKGWLRANAEINANERGAHERAIRVVESFGKSRSIAEEELSTVRLATHGDNLNFLGLNRRYLGEKGEDLYHYFWKRYSQIMRGIPKKPRWSTIADPSLVRSVSLSGDQHRPEPMHDFAYCLSPEHQRPLSSKSLQVTFPTNGARLSQEAKRDIEDKFGHLAEIYFEDCIRLDGNTDNVGPRSYNLKLSRRRAESVKAFLVQRYGFDPRRIITVGHGPDKPVASNATEAGRALNRRTDFELLH